MAHISSVESMQSKPVWVAKYNGDTFQYWKLPRRFVLKRVEDTLQGQLLTASISSLRLCGHSAKKMGKNGSSKCTVSQFEETEINSYTNCKQSAELDGWLLAGWGTN